MRTIGRNYGGGKMFVNQRFKLIADYLKEKKKATVEELAALLYVSPATIRRDLLEMQKMGVIARTHGGALYIENSAEISIFVRLEKNAREKEQAASVPSDTCRPSRRCSSTIPPPASPLPNAWT